MCNCTCSKSEKKIINASINEYKEYLKCRKVFDQYHGIFQPIRAAVRVYSCNATMSIEELLSTTEEFAELNRLYTTKTATVLTENEVMQRTTTVGYFSAWSKLSGDQYLKFGCSFCRPKDYPNFQKYRGKLLAMHDRACVYDIDDALKRIFIDIDEKTRVFDPFHEKFFNMPNLSKVNRGLFMADTTCDHLVIYFFPKDLVTQARLFFDRCCRYYGHRHLDDMIGKIEAGHNILYQF